MSIDTTTWQWKSTINKEETENVTNFENLGSIINKNRDYSKEVKETIIAMQSLNSFKDLLHTNKEMKVRTCENMQLSSVNKRLWVRDDLTMSEAVKLGFWTDIL